MKCPKCNGKGKVLDYVAERNCHGEWEMVLREIPCDKCQRKPMTNEEWLHLLNTEELANFLNLIVRVGPYENEPKDFWEHVYGRGGERGARSIVEWLKQPHTPKE